MTNHAHFVGGPACGTWCQLPDMPACIDVAGAVITDSPLEQAGGRYWLRLITHQDDHRTDLLYLHEVTE